MVGSKKCSSVSPGKPTITSTPIQAALLPEFYLLFQYILHVGNGVSSTLEYHCFLIATEYENVAQKFYF
jgi:hypothetical protein